MFFVLPAPKKKKILTGKKSYFKRVRHASQRNCKTSTSFRYCGTYRQDANGNE